MDTFALDLVTLVLLIVVFVSWTLWQSFVKYGMPPGPRPLPVLGNMWQVDVKKPYQSYLELSKQYGPVFTVWLAGRPVVVLSGYQTLREALLGQADEFSGRAVYQLLKDSTSGLGILGANGNCWREMRSFTLSTLRSFGMGKRSIEEQIREEAGCLVEAFSKHTDHAFNPRHLLANAVSNIICSIIFGHRFDYDDPQFLLLYSAIHRYFQFLNSWKGQLYNMFPAAFRLLSGTHRHVLHGCQQIKSFIQTQAQKREQSFNHTPPADFIQAFQAQMLQEREKPNSEFHYDNLQSTVFSLFSAGTETTTSTLRYGLQLMIKYPHIQERVQKEIDEAIGSEKIPSLQDRHNMPYTDAVVHEIQRFLDLAPCSVPHIVIKNTTFRNYRIPKGTMVIPLLSSALRDPDLWKNPGEFDPENFLDENGLFKKNAAFLPFGLGKRVCLGEGMAKIELFLFFTCLLQKFSFFATQPLEDVDISPLYSSFGRLPRNFECYVKIRHQG